MNKEESIQQIETLIEAWQLDEADLNQTDINAMQALLEENQELKKQLEDANEKILLLQASEPMLNYKKALEETQQKEFIKYLEDEISKLKKEYGNYVYDDYSEEKGKYDTYIEILQKYKEIIGDDK